MPRPSTGTGLTIVQLQQILDQRQAELDKLHKRRERVQRELDDIDKQIGKLEGGPSAGRGGGRGGSGNSGGGGGTGRRARNAQSLVETLGEVLRAGKGAMSIGDIVEAVKRGGYRSNAANFRGLVNQTLIKEKKRFAQIERGMYGLRGEGSGGGGGGGKKGKAKADAEGQAA